MKIKDKRFKIGDSVIYKNDYGVSFKLKVTGYYPKTGWLYNSGYSYMLNSSSFWMPVKESSLSLVVNTVQYGDIYDGAKAIGLCVPCLIRIGRGKKASYWKVVEDPKQPLPVWRKSSEKEFELINKQ